MHGADPAAVTAAPRPQLTKRGSEYAVLLGQVRQAGLLQRRTRWYAWRIAITGVLMAAGWAAFVLAGDSWWQLPVAVYLAVMFTQAGFIGHDAGHRQILGSRRGNYVLGLLHGNLAVGLSYGWWVSKHNRHHAHPNTEGADPDIMLAAVAFTAGQARRGRGAARLLYRWQAWLLFPMLLLEAVSIHVASIRALATRASPGRSWEALLLGGHLAGYLALILLVLPPVKAAVFIAVQQGLFGLYLGCSFAPNHKGMAILSAGDRTGYLHRQVLTSRNVRGGWLTGLAFGGLNYQIEHHLFPSMPRPNLRRSQALTEAFCRRRDIPYCQDSLVGSYAQALRHLAAVGRLTRAPEVPAARR